MCKGFVVGSMVYGGYIFIFVLYSFSCFVLFISSIFVFFLKWFGLEDKLYSCFRFAVCLGIKRSLEC